MSAQVGIDVPPTLICEVKNPLWMIPVSAGSAGVKEAFTADDVGDGAELVLDAGATCVGAGLVGGELTAASDPPTIAAKFRLSP